MMSSSLNSSADSPERMDMLVSELKNAIHTGNIPLTKDLATQASNCRLNLNICISKDQPIKEDEFEVNVHLEDKNVGNAVIKLHVKASDTIADIKRKFWLQKKISTELQRWIIGKKIPDDQMTLESCGVTCEDFTIFVYIMTACRSSEVEEWSEQSERDSVDPSLMSSSLLSHDEQTIVYNMSGKKSNSAIDGFKHEGFASLQPSPSPNTTQKPIPSEDYHDPEETKVVDVPGHLWELEKLPHHGWTCPSCTFINFPTRPGCKQCSTDRPIDYIIPIAYSMTDEEVAMMLRHEDLELQARQIIQEARRNNYLQWIKSDGLDLVRNVKEFSCPICMDDIDPGEGVMLRNCLHEFCITCIQGAVTHSEEPTLKCPYTDGNQSCEGILQEREIRTLVPEDLFIKYLQRSLDQAESQAPNSFHCKTADCKGWCLYEDEVNFFKCPICNKENCLTCKVIHEGMNCRQYQEDLKTKAVNNGNAMKTQILIQDMFNRGLAMHCPKCRIIVQKKEGCDWIKCSICKTEICWVTKSPRWGPKGHGDISGGCRCGVDGLCHPQCGNCH